MRLQGRARVPGRVLLGGRGFVQRVLAGGEKFDFAGTVETRVYAKNPAITGVLAGVINFELEL